MTRLAITLARAAVHRPWAMLAAWAATVIGLALAFAAIGTAYDDELTVPGSDAEIAAALLEGEPSGAGSTMVIAGPTALTGPAEHDRVAAIVADAGRIAAVELTDPLADPARATASGRLSPDAQAVTIAIPADVDALPESALDELARLTETESTDGWQVAFGGQLARAMDAEHSRLSEIVGIAVAVVALSAGLASVAAMATPVIAGLVAVVAGISSLGLLSHAATIPEIAPTLATMIGLGVGIDYALFQVARMRQLLDRGASVNDAVVATAASAGAAAAFAGGTVALAICALALSGVAFIGWLGYASAIVVLVVVVSSLTFTPALLRLLGSRVRARAGRGSDEGRGIRRVTAAVVARPWVSAVAAFAFLAILAAPTAALSLGITGPGDRPVDTQARAAYDLTAEHFGEGANAALTVAVTLDPPAADASDPRLAELTAAIDAAGAAATTPLSPTTSDPAVATAKVTPLGDANAASTATLIEDLRAIDAPAGADLHVGGATATRIDLEQRVTERLPWVVVAVVAASTVVLTVAFRSLLIPLKAALLNLVSVAAAYGVVVAVFQWGWGASWIGLDGPVAIDAFVPMILFVVLFGLSTDYEVFLVTAMREHWDRTHDVKASIVEGMRSSGRVVTLAALIMVSVFASFVLDADPTVKVFGLGLAASIVIDATVVRMLLVPSLMMLLGRWAWWVPRWLGRILPAPHGAPTSHSTRPEPAPTAASIRVP